MPPTDPLDLAALLDLARAVLLDTDNRLSAESFVNQARLVTGLRKAVARLDDDRDAGLRVRAGREAVAVAGVGN